MVQRKVLWIALAVMVTIALAAIAVSAADKENLVGTYKMISDTRKNLETGEVSYTFGENPVGYIMYGKDGRMLVIVLNGDRPKPAGMEKTTPEQQAALFGSMLAYGGTYEFDGTKMEHHIDISWNEIWTGTTTVRYVRKEGDRLIYTTAPFPFPDDVKSVTTLVWEKIK